MQLPHALPNWQWLVPTLHIAHLTSGMKLRQALRIRVLQAATIEGPPELLAAEGRGTSRCSGCSCGRLSSWDGCCGRRAIGAVRGFEYFFDGSLLPTVWF